METKTAKQSTPKIWAAKFVQRRVGNEQDDVIVLDVVREQIRLSLLTSAKSVYVRHRVSRTASLYYNWPVPEETPDQTRLESIHASLANIQGLVYFVQHDAKDIPVDLPASACSIKAIEAYLIKCVANLELMVKDAKQQGIALVWKTGLLVGGSSAPPLTPLAGKVV